MAKRLDLEIQMLPGPEKWAVGREPELSLKQRGGDMSRTQGWGVQPEGQEAGAQKGE